MKGEFSVKKIGLLKKLLSKLKNYNPLLKMERAEGHLLEVGRLLQKIRYYMYISNNCFSPFRIK